MGVNVWVGPGTVNLTPTFSPRMGGGGWLYLIFDLQLTNDTNEEINSFTIDLGTVTLTKNMFVSRQTSTIGDWNCVADQI